MHRRARGANQGDRHGAAESSTAKPKPRAPRKHKSAKRASRGQRGEELLAAIKANPGARPSELAGAIGVKPAQVHNPIGKPRAEKLIVKRGKGYVLKA